MEADVWRMRNALDDRGRRTRVDLLLSSQDARVESLVWMAEHDDVHVLLGGQRIKSDDFAALLERIGLSALHVMLTKGGGANVRSLPNLVRRALASASGNSATLRPMSYAKLRALCPGVSYRDLRFLAEAGHVELLVHPDLATGQGPLRSFGKAQDAHPELYVVVLTTLGRSFVPSGWSG
jgi:hypothetical protein